MTLFRCEGGSGPLMPYGLLHTTALDCLNTVLKWCVVTWWEGRIAAEFTVCVLAGCSERKGDLLFKCGRGKLLSPRCNPELETILWVLAFWTRMSIWLHWSLGFGAETWRYVLCLVLEGDMSAKDLQTNCLILNTCWPQYIAGLRLLHQVPGKTEMQKLLMLWFKLTNVVIAS